MNVLIMKRTVDVSFSNSEFHGHLMMVGVFQNETLIFLETKGSESELHLKTYAFTNKIMLIIDIV